VNDTKSRQSSSRSYYLAEIACQYVGSSGRRRSRSVKRFLILLVLLEHEDHALNANRIRILLDKMSIKTLGDDIRDGKVSSGMVSEFCRELEKKGFVESKMAKPPRRKNKTTHYSLPIKDEEKMLKVTQLFLDRAGMIYLRSKYSRKFIDEHLIRLIKKEFKCNINAEQSTVIKQICYKSPSALKRALNPWLDNQIQAMVDRMDAKPSAELLIQYLEKYEHTCALG
jgi:hypothetical protein